jgi:hypothetical protein
MTKSELKEYEKLLPAHAALWETRTNPGEAKNVWYLVEPNKLSATAKIKLRDDDEDGTISASSGKSPSDYTIIADSPLTNVTGVMLETLPDDKLPRFGPGHHEDGNFVLSEIEMEWGVGTNAPDKSVKFVDANADFSQKDFSPKQAIDGKLEAGRNGWAIAGAPGIQRHTATFKLETPIGATNGPC